MTNPLAKRRGGRVLLSTPLLAVMAFTGGLLMQSPQLAHAAVPVQTQASVNVPATTTLPGVDTGINLIAGQQFNVFAFGTANCRVPAGTDCESGPEGAHPGHYFFDHSMGHCGNESTDGFSPCPDSTKPFGRLVGRVSQSPSGSDNQVDTFHIDISTGGTFTAPATGRLWLIYNDGSCCYGDNSGGYTANISVGYGGSSTFGWDNPGTSAPPSCTCGDPVNTATGNLTETATDLAVPGRGRALDLMRTYNAQGAAFAAGPGTMGFGWSQSYGMRITADASGDQTVHQENGSTVTFIPSGGGYSAAPSVTATLVHNGDGTFTYTRKDQRADVFAADDSGTSGADGRLLSQSDRFGEHTTLTYDSAGHLAAVTDPAGRQFTVTSDATGLITQVVDPMGRTVHYTYAGGDLTSVTDVNGGVTAYSYTTHLLTSMTDPRGGVSQSTYDTLDRVTQQIDPAGRSTTFSYASGSTTITDGLGHQVVQTFDSNNQLTSLTRGAGTAVTAKWTYTYDGALNRASLADPNGHTWTASHDSRGNPLTRKDPLNRTTTFTYDSRNDLTTATDPMGVTTTLTYEGHGGLISIVRPLTSSAQIAATSITRSDGNHPGDVTAITDPTARTWQYTYDTAGNTTSQTDPAGDRTTTSSNLDGWPTATVDPRGNEAGATPASFSRQVTYDLFGDPTQQTDALGHTTQTLYDANRNVVTKTDANGNSTHFAYDGDNALTQVTRPNGTTLSNTYDAAGNLASQVDGLGHATTYQYDAQNRTTASTDPLSRTTTSAYDGPGKLTAVHDPLGRTTNFAYDVANQITGITYSDSTTPNVTYAYDGDGRRTSMTDGSGTTTTQYDSLGRLTNDTNGASLAVGYQYDLAGRATSITYPLGTAVTQSYDAAGRLASVADWLGNVTTFNYDSGSELTGEFYPNGIAGQRTYDRANRVATITYGPGGPGSAMPDIDVARLGLASLIVFGGLGLARRRKRGRLASGAAVLLLLTVTLAPVSLSSPTPAAAAAPIASFSYTRDAAGFLTSSTSTGVSQPNETYTDTSLNQLSGVNGAAYTYDAADNVTKLADGSALSYDAANELTQMIKGGSTSAFTYDGLGERITSNAPSSPSALTYDQAGRLTGAGATNSYTYDGTGLRMRKLVTAVPHLYAWDVARGLSLLLQDSATQFIYGPGGLPVEQVSAGAVVTFLHQDQLGSTRVLTDKSAAVVGTMSYDAYGRPTDPPPGPTATTTPLGFAGQYTDAETGFQYLRARYYDPATAQFITRDPLLPLTRQAYAYANDNPLNNTDPTGLASWSVPGGIPITSGGGPVAPGVVAPGYPGSSDQMQQSQTVLTQMGSDNQKQQMERWKLSQDQNSANFEALTDPFATQPLPTTRQFKELDKYVSQTAGGPSGDGSGGMSGGQTCSAPPPPANGGPDPAPGYGGTTGGTAGGLGFYDPTPQPPDLATGSGGLYSGPQFYGPSPESPYPPTAPNASSGYPAESMPPEPPYLGSGGLLSGGLSV